MAELDNYPTLKKFLTQASEPINKAIEHYCIQLGSDEFIDALASQGVPEASKGFDKEMYKKSIVTPIIYSLKERAGKRFRPFIARVFHDICRGDGAAYVHCDDLIIMPEIGHQATLINDDIADKTSERNKQQTTHIKFGPEIAGNAGDALYFAAKLPLYFPQFFLRNKNGKPEVGRERKSEIIEAYDTEILRAHIGQAHDIAWSIDKVVEHPEKLPTKEQYFQMAGAKGATMPFATKLGAILGGAAQNQREASRLIGEHAALGFQIRDDVVELENTKLSDYGEDIKERKVTLPMLIALEKDDATKEKMRNALSRTIFTRWAVGSEIEEVIGVMKDCNAIKDANEIALTQRDRAIELVREHFQNPKSKEACQVLEDLLDYAVTRTG